MGLSLDLVELADKATPAALIAEILKQNPLIPVPTPLEELARLAGISDIHDSTSDSFEGMLVADPEKSAGVILVNRNRPLARRRFTLGHELGHFLLPWHRPKGGSEVTFRCDSNDMGTVSAPASNIRKFWELQANEFSSELLMPAPLIRSRIKTAGEPSLAHVVALSAEFQTSMEATARRYVTLHDYSVALVFIKDGVVRYTLKGREFGFFLDTNKGARVPFGSKCLEPSSDDTLGEICSVDSATWIDSGRGRTPPGEIMEQTLTQREGYKIVLLQAEPDEDDDE